MTTNIVYKVVCKQHPTDNHYVSLMYDMIGRHSLRYNLNIETRVLLSRSLIFCFNELEVAKRYADMHERKCYVLECETDCDIFTIRYRAKCNMTSIDIFWEDTNFNFEAYCVQGTVGVEKLTPRKVVY